jgi:hypothetical protein
MITLFEKFTDKKYKKGDYVILKSDAAPVSRFSDEETSTEIECLITYIHQNNSENFWYDIEVFDNSGNLVEIDIYSHDVERMMTTEEIERYKLRKIAYKYNL